MPIQVVKYQLNNIAGNGCIHPSAHTVSGLKIQLLCTSEKTLPNCNGQSLQTGFHREVMMMQKFSRLVPAGHTRGRPKIKAIIL